MNSVGPRLSLGTAQWGDSYGITNSRGKLSDADVAAVVQVARDFGIVDVDTHRTANSLHGYGQAQIRLKPWARDFAITTKVFAGSSADAPIADQLSSSLADLGVRSVHACLVHDWYELTEAQAESAVLSLRVAHDQGIIDRLGISAYDTRDLERASAVFGASLSAVQVPCSVLDQRMRDSAALDAIQSRGTEIQVRSIFLQGLLLEPTSQSRLAQHPSLVRFHRYCSDRGLSPLATCLSFVRSLAWVNRVVIGVTSAVELAQIAEYWTATAVTADWGALAADDLELLDPRSWRRPQP